MTYSITEIYNALEVTGLQLIDEETVYFDEQQADDAEELRSLLDETYSDGKQIILQDDYADAVTYDWAKETLDEFAAEYYETILK